jgi:hypothetical protein
MLHGLLTHKDIRIPTTNKFRGPKNDKSCQCWAERRVYRVSESVTITCEQLKLSHQLHDQPSLFTQESLFSGSCYLTPQWSCYVSCFCVCCFCYSKVFSQISIPIKENSFLGLLSYLCSLSNPFS